MIDIAAVARNLLPRSRSLLAEWFPTGRFNGHEFELGSLQGEAGKSLRINWTSGQWADFATGEKGGDLVSLYAAANHVTQLDAARVLDDTTIPTVENLKEKKPRNVITPVPDSVPLCACYHWKLGKASHVWNYRDASGKLLGHVARYDTEQGKEIIPWTYAKDKQNGGKWGMGQWPSPRPLYGLDDLAVRPDAVVLIVEGEKATDAARKFFSKSYVVVTWPGGCKAVHKVDFSVLRGREILLWPDNDDPGVGAMWTLGHQLLKQCPSVKIVIPSEVSEGFDAADALAAGWTWAQFKEWALPRIKELRENGGSSDVQRRDEAETEAAAPGEVAPAEAADGVRFTEVFSSRSLPSGTEATDRGAAQGSGNSHAGAGTGVVKARSEARPDAGNRGRQLSAGDQAGRQADEVQKQEWYSVASRIIKWTEFNLDMNGQGQPQANLNNAVAVLEQDELLAGMIWFDEFLQRTMTIGADKQPREWIDADDINLTLYMQRVSGIVRMAKETVAQAVIAVAMRHLRNCVRDWLDGLQWDGVPRIASFFEDHFGADGTPYVRSAAKNFWLSMVARIFEPGCKMDNTIVIEGGQGRGKSQVVEVIGGPFFMEQKEDVDTKDFFQVIQGKWIIEVSEMHSFSRAAMSRTKQAISCRSDRYRASYDRRAADHPRQCVFIITTNHYDWNKDETGARRYWPIRVQGDVDVAEVRRRRSDLFAEAVALFKGASNCDDCREHFNGRCAVHDWWTMPADETAGEQQKRFDGDPWMEFINEFVEMRADVTVTDVLIDCLKLEKGKITRSDQMRVASSLKALGWENIGNKRSGHQVIKVWRRSDDPDGRYRGYQSLRPSD